MTGLSSLTGYVGGSPQEVGISYGDPNGGIDAASAICGALVARKRTGQGQYIDVSLWEGVAALMHEGWMEYTMNGVQPPRMGNRDPLMSPHNCFRCAGEDEWVTIACGTEEEWQAFCNAIDQAQLAADPRFRTAQDRKTHEDELEAIISAWTATQGKWDVTRTLQAAGVAAFPSMNSKDLAEDASERTGILLRLQHAEVGVQTHTGIPEFNECTNESDPAPPRGDTDSIMRELLGFSSETIAKLKEEQVLY
jgi:crotonobetainyl-CoA:carnitine CoA-transferase CaiB-like acyl-CoA transferase